MTTKARWLFSRRSTSARVLPEPAPTDTLLKLGVASVIFLVAYDDGGYDLSSRSIIAISLWWAIIICVVLGVLPLARQPRPATVAGGLLAGLAAWTLASAAWGSSAERAFGEFNRVTLYVAV